MRAPKAYETRYGRNTSMAADKKDYRKIMVPIDHRFALSRPALLSAPSKKLNSALRSPCGERNGSVLDCARKGAAVTILVACNPVKKHGPWVVARLRVVTPSGDPV
jgi:hypothetical protein